jgi:hypothetical protein
MYYGDVKKHDNSSGKGQGWATWVKIPIYRRYTSEF